MWLQGAEEGRDARKENWTLKRSSLVPQLSLEVTYQLSSAFSLLRAPRPTCLCRVLFLVHRDPQSLVISAEYPFAVCHPKHISSLPPRNTPPT